MRQKNEEILTFILKNKKNIRIILIAISIIVICIMIFYFINKKRLEMEKNTDVSNSIHAITIDENAVLYKKAKESKLQKIFNIEEGTNAYILEETINNKNEKWYKVKCNDRIGYVLSENLDYFMPSDNEYVLMSDVSKFNIQFKHFENTKDYQLFLIKNDINYVYIRAGGRGYGEEGNFYTDKQFKIFIDACEYLKIPYGFYYIDEAVNSEEIDEEVEFMRKFIETNSTAMNKLPLAIDIETHDGAGRADEIWEDRAFLAEELVQKFNNIGIRNIIYSNARTANEYLWNVNSNFWIAYYPEIGKIPDFWYTDTDQEPVQNLEFMDKVIAWQFTESGAGEEIKEKVDISLVKNNFFKQFIQE